MLRRFVYLDTDALDQYVTALEGGRLTELTQRVSNTGEGSGGVDLKVAKGSVGKSHEDERASTLSDTDGARFDRLLKAAQADSESLAWIEGVQPDVDFAQAFIGAMVSWECDLYVPEIVQLLARSGEMQDAMNLIQSVLPAADTLGLSTEGLPSEAEMSAMGTALNAFNANLLVVGDDEETPWKVAGSVSEEYLHGELEGRARLVGKVSKVLGQGRWRPFTTFPGMNLMSRDQRRKLERQAPKPGEEDQYLSGPALMLDLLAIYR